jgi:molecular chaperone DnaK (HSP70)
MSIVGLDFGNLSLVIAQTSKGGVECILNDASNRQTATTVSIQGKQRHIGDAGAAMVSIATFGLLDAHIKAEGIKDLTKENEN